MPSRRVVAVTAAGAVLAALSATALPGYADSSSAPSWDAGNDFLAGSSASNTASDTWQYLAAPHHTHTASDYVLLPTHHDTGCGSVDGFDQWDDSGSAPAVLKNDDTTSPHQCGTATIPAGGLAAVPGATADAVVAWKSPVTAVVSLTGSLSDADGSCGDGVGWSLDHGNTTLASGTVANGGHTTLPQHSGSVDLGRVLVHAGDLIALHVSSGAANDASCDVTVLDLLVTQVVAQVSDLVVVPGTRPNGPVISVGWNDPAGNDGARVCLRVGTTPDSSPTQCAHFSDVADSGGSSAPLPAVKSGQSITVSVFGYSGSGANRVFAPGLAVRLAGTTATVNAPATVRRGATFTVSTALRDAATRAGLRGRTVSLWRRSTRSGSAWHQLAALRTGRGGTARVHVQERSSSIYEWRYQGRRNVRMSTVSPMLTVKAS